MNHRDRPLLNLAHRLHECTNCGRWQEHGCNPCHENGLAAGKGVRIKAHDHRHFAGCNLCHEWYDVITVGRDPSGAYLPSREGKLAMFDRAHKRTYDEYWRRGWLAVSTSRA